MTAGTDLDAAHDGDFVAWSGYLTMLAPVPGTALTGSIGINATRLDQSGAREDLSSAWHQARTSGECLQRRSVSDSGATPASRTMARIHHVVRRDDIVSIGGATFYRMETPLFGRPSVDLHRLRIHLADQGIRPDPHELRLHARFLTMEGKKPADGGKPDDRLNPASSSPSRANLPPNGLEQSTR